MIDQDYNITPAGFREAWQASGGSLYKTVRDNGLQVSEAARLALGGGFRRPDPFLEAVRDSQAEQAAAGKSAAEIGESFLKPLAKDPSLNRAQRVTVQTLMAGLRKNGLTDRMAMTVERMGAGAGVAAANEPNEDSRRAKAATARGFAEAFVAIGSATAREARARINASRRSEEILA